jgi:hypothetical protein
MDDHETVIDQTTLIASGAAHDYTVYRYATGDVFLQSHLCARPDVPGDAFYVPAALVGHLARVLRLADLVPLLELDRAPVRDVRPVSGHA